MMLIITRREFLVNLGQNSGLKGVNLIYKMRVKKVRI